MKISKRSLIVATIASMATMNASGQNGGQKNENNYLKIEHVGIADHSALIRVINKQECPLEIRMTHGMPTDTLFWVKGKDTVVVKTPFESKLVKATSDTKCGPIGNDQGWVEIALGAILPVKFTSFSVLPIDKDRVRLEFSYEDMIGVQKFEIMVSTDGVNYKPVMIVLPDDRRSATYSLIVNLK